MTIDTAAPATVTVDYRPEDVEVLVEILTAVNDWALAEADALSRVRTPRDRYVAELNRIMRMATHAARLRKQLIKAGR